MSLVLFIVFTGIVIWVAAVSAGGITALIGVLLIGAIAGWLAGVLTRGRGFGIVRNILIGMIGSVLGRMLLGLVGLYSVGTVGSLATATVGAVALLYSVRRLLGPA
jgi:uncharacterized membrane protein YeaQ/YmgE (transglycosylase-associated protein family)